MPLVRRGVIFNPNSVSNAVRVLCYGFFCRVAARRDPAIRVAALFLKRNRFLKPVTFVLSIFSAKSLRLGRFEDVRLDFSSNLA